MHAPAGYLCPFCALAGKYSVPGLLSGEEDIFYRDGRMVAFVGSRTWPGSEGNAIIIPAEHYENIHDLPDDLAAGMAVLAKRIATLYKELLGADGTTLRQHNEPAGDQDVWHSHLHVLPRTSGVSLYLGHAGARRQEPADRDRVVAAMRAAFINS